MLVVSPKAALATFAHKAKATTPKARENMAARWYVEEMFPGTHNNNLLFPLLVQRLIYLQQVPTLHLKPSMLNGGDLPLALLRLCMLFGDRSELAFGSTNLATLFASN